MRLLIIGKADSQIGVASRIAQDHGAKVVHAQTPEAGLSLLLSGKGADMLLIDVTLDIKACIDQLDKEHISIPVVGFGINADSEKAANAIRAGAKEYLPFPPDETMIAAILEAITEENRTVIYASDAMKKVMEMADRVAPSEASVLITGESGTGKEVLAQYIHQKSNRAKEPFISVNCAAIPDNLLESEMFGHEKGSFTGASHQRIGKFEESNNGTLLLDEISEMDLRLQAKLLRAIQEQEIDRVGGKKPIKLNLRVIATSNRNLQKEVEEGNFREDLYFRLNVIQLPLPPLRERKEDITLFAEHFAKKYADANNLPHRPLAPEALAKLQAHTWPGNVRELENTMHRAVLMATGDAIDTAAIIIQNSSSTNGTSENGSTELVGRTVADVERDLIQQTLAHCLGNRTHAANILGISIRTLRNKLKLYSEVEARE